MKKLLILFSLFFFVNSDSRARQTGDRKWVLVIHGGAGTILKSQMTPEKEKAYNAALEEALAKGEAILNKGGSALDAVEAAVRSMEDNPLFNAGKGAVFTNAGKNELDAAIMDGRNLAAGSVAGVTVVKNPITAARAVMEKSPHVMMAGPGAELFATSQGLDIVDPSYFYTDDRWKGLRRMQQRDSIENLKKSRTRINLEERDPVNLDQVLVELNALEAELVSCGNAGERKEILGEIAVRRHLLRETPHGDKFGTVGAVALDRQGNLAAATSTGGMMNKKFGRIGDAPIIGAGTYANNKTVAISATGWGEFFIRLVMAKTISDRMEYGKEDLKSAADEMVMKQLPGLGGDGGLIAVDKDGNIALPFCTSGMYRGYSKEGGEKKVMIYKED